MYLENHLLDICQTYETGIQGGVDDSYCFRLQGQESYM